MRIPVSLALCAFLVTLGCDTSGIDPEPVVVPPPPSPVAEVLVPLAVGNLWVYDTEKVRYEFGSGQRIDEGVVRTSDTLRVVGDQVIDGET
jgi:hypothetical protein